MNVTLYYNKSPQNKLIKSITQVVSLTNCTFKEDTSIINPHFIISTTINNVINSNYIYVEELNRYYYITEYVSLNNNMFQIICHVDVLMSHATEIKNNEAIIRRNESYYNLYLNDGVFKCYQNPVIVTKVFPNGFSNPEFVLAVAGNNSANSSAQAES